MNERDDVFGYDYIAAHMFARSKGIRLGEHSLTPEMLCECDVIPPEFYDYTVLHAAIMDSSNFIYNIRFTPIEPSEEFIEACDAFTEETGFELTRKTYDITRAFGDMGEHGMIVPSRNVIAPIIIYRLSDMGIEDMAELTASSGLCHSSYATCLDGKTGRNIRNPFSKSTKTVEIMGVKVLSEHCTSSRPPLKLHSYDVKEYVRFLIDVSGLEESFHGVDKRSLLSSAAAFEFRYMAGLLMHMYHKGQADTAKKIISAPIMKTMNHNHVSRMMKHEHADHPMKMVNELLDITGWKLDTILTSKILNDVIHEQTRNGHILFRVPVTIPDGIIDEPKEDTRYMMVSLSTANSIATYVSLDGDSIVRYNYQKYYLNNEHNRIYVWDEMAETMKNIEEYISADDAA